MASKVVVTGLGVICSIGNNLDEFEQNLREGKSGLKDISTQRFDLSDEFFRSRQGCTIDQGIYETAREKDVTILGELSVRAIGEALERANLDLSSTDPRRVGLCLGTSVGGSYPFMDWVKNKIKGEERDYALLLHITPNITSRIAAHFGIRGPLSTISTACASGTNSIGRAFDLIRSNRVDCMIAGGVDIFTYLTYSGFNSLFALSKGACQPFDKGRDGLNLGDAAAYVVMESLESAQKRNAPILAEVSGYSIVNEAYHATAPHPDGIFAKQAMFNALKMSGATPSQVDYINAHGTATLANDKMEIRAIEQLVDGHPVYVSSTKSLIGHALGAAGSVEFVATTLGVYKNFVPPSINVKESIVTPDNIRLVEGKAIDYKINLALSNSFGFSGNMASVAIRNFN
ncbi:MAG: beta-ketoacyl-[acyl-carrier-protein] synthase family protein [Saprospiraceae bacterium]|nr:beta-ketoacyl-[acyl-carrier-protein] synthase family protein [Saprospiraceae bacterium]MDZ4703046.1 beta-ketoacyl-[acyl-carrier-protein] synthase family protein [Saprospiraceae bacterium]